MLHRLAAAPMWCKCGAPYLCVSRVPVGSLVATLPPCSPPHPLSAAMSLRSASRMPHDRREHSSWRKCAAAKMSECSWDARNDNGQHFKVVQSAKPRSRLRRARTHTRARAHTHTHTHTHTYTHAHTHAYTHIHVYRHFMVSSPDYTLQPIMCIEKRQILTRKLPTFTQHSPPFQSSVHEIDCRVQQRQEMLSHFTPPPPTHTPKSKYAARAVGCGEKVHGLVQVLCLQERMYNSLV